MWKKYTLWENPRGCNRGFKVTKSEVTTSSQVEPSSPWPHDPEPPAHPLHHLSTYGMVVLQGLFAIFAGKWAFHITCESLPSEAAWVHERRGRNLRFAAMQQQLTKKSTWLGMGSSCFICLHLRCSSANELRESMKPDGREAFRSLNVLPQNNAQHSLSRTTESVTTHSVHWASAFVQESGFVKDLGEFLGRNQGPWIWGARISIANHKDVLEIDHKKWVTLVPNQLFTRICWY